MTRLAAALLLIGGCTEVAAPVRPHMGDPDASPASARDTEADLRAADRGPRGDGDAGHDAASGKPILSGVAGSGMPAGQPEGDPCLVANGGCARGEYCQAGESGVVCSQCTADLLDEDGECGPALLELDVAEGTLDPPFSSTQRSYRVNLPLVAQRVSIRAQARADATVLVDDHALSAGDPVYQSDLLPLAEVSFEVVVRGQGDRDRRYSVTVQRQGKVAGYLKGDDTDAADNYGRAIALASGRVAVGAFYADGIGNATNDTGAVYIYKREASGYTQVDRLYPAAPERSAFFGSALAMNDQTLFVGTPYSRLPNEQTVAGRVAVYAREGEQWREHDVLQPAQGQAGDWFGISLALDGQTLAIGAARAGAVYIYEERDGQWQFSQRLDDGSSDSAGSRFGAAVALQDGTLVVGAPDRARGEAHVFRRDATGAFSGHQRLTWPEASAEGFGTAVSLYGSVIAVGAPGSLNISFKFEGQDAVYLFERGSDDAWSARSQPVLSHQMDNSSFGIAVQLLSESTLAVGAAEARASGDVFGATPGAMGVPATGGVYLFADLGEGFVFDQLLNAPQPGAADWFGYVLASDGERLAVTAMHEASSARVVDGDAADNRCEQCGAAYIFE